MQILGEENFTPEVVEYIHKNKAKVAIDKLERSEAENLGFKYSDDVRLTIDSEAIQHTLKRHGAESDLVKNSGQIPVEYKDIAEYRNIVKNADESLRARDNAGNDVIVSYRQINGYAVVVEQIRKKNNELSFKTMFKQNGDYKNSKSYKETSALNQTLSIGYEPSANSFSKTEAPQKAVNESIAENEAKKSLFESSENFYDYEKKLLREISIEGLDKQNAKDKLYFNTIQTYMEKLGNFEKELSNIVQEVRPFLSLNQKDKIINKLYRQRDKKDFRNSLKELVYFYVHKDKLGIDDIHKVTMDYVESMAKYVKGLLPYDNHPSFEKLVKEKKLFDEVIRQENKPSVKPLDEFGINFEGFKGKEAINKLLEEQRGQVAGAFYKEGLGEIDLVWGDENFGLRHILEQRTKQWGEEKALKFISHLNENIEKGQIVEVQKGRAAIKTDLTTIILDKKENNNFVLTAFRDRNNKKELESLNLSQSKTFTSENAEANAKESPVTSLNQESIIAQKAKNDEVLEAEVIEEVGLNEPMKFLEFQQRKLLTYIKENTPLKLLEHKKELKTRDILNFLEQSALNGKQKVFLMRNLERDLGKIELKIKENESVKAKIKNTYEISQSEAKELGEHFNFKGKKPLLRELRENEIKHALKSHGNKESEEARGNIAITLQDIEANYPKITQEFDEKFFTQKGVIYVKQVNGHHIVIEEALSGQDKLIFKTMWKTKGNYNKEVLLKNAKTSPYPQNADEAVRLETISKQELEQSNPQQSHLSTDESIAQNSEKLPFEMQ
ncbi:hypothetical protein ACH155_001678, partial [Campylobacter upsaliensis]